MEKLKELRLKAKKTQKDVANDLNISFQSYSNYENDYRKPDPDMLSKLADYFDVSIDYLLGREEKYYPDKDEHELVPAPQLDNVYYNLAKEAQEKGIPVSDFRRIMAIYEQFKKDEEETNK